MTPARLLLVDDEPNIIKSLQRLFFDEDYEVHCALSGEDGLEILQSQEVDLIIADYRMSGINGIEFFRHARHLQPDAVRIILSGFAEIRVLTDAINEGNIYRFIFKPWNDDELKNTIQLALQQQRLVLENRSLALELQRKNDQLSNFNRELEIQVQQRARELLFQNKVLRVSQEILEYVPVGVVGFSGEGIVVVMNQLARDRFAGSVGQTLEEVIPLHLAECCRDSLLARAEEVQLNATIEGSDYQVEIRQIRQTKDVHGGVLIFSGGPQSSAPGILRTSQKELASPPSFEPTEIVYESGLPA
jgi:two-component system NtrC family sensor kinase